ncbi:hypothetical protein FD754_002730 [Muntiacus muntjak]|uniref:ERC protein 2 n=1 Tax=Muntiacus muntjak TaxID=9888 RepID=A0A5N3WAT8_MUNMU|nr:hypothetical protein FD754_002730 [Muntiacus muntjak]
MYGSARTITNLEGSPSRSPRLPRSPRLGHRRTSSGGGGGTGKTLSMENIQSLNAAYATSGPMYLSDHEGVASTTYPKGTMTLGRATNRAVYGGRVTAMGSSPNIASAGLSHTDVLSYTDQHGGLTSSSHHHHHQVPSMLRQVRDSTMLDLQAQLKELQRENDLLRKELDIKDSKLGSSMNSIKTFWSPELKKERVLRKEEAARMSVLKEQMRVSHEENQVGLISFRMDWLDILAAQGTLKSLLQYHSSKASILQHSACFIVQLSHPYVTTGKTIALTRRTFVGKIMSLLFNMMSRLVITFFPRSKHLLISWLQSLSAVILEPKKGKRKWQPTPAWCGWWVLAWRIPGMGPRVHRNISDLFENLLFILLAALLQARKRVPGAGTLAPQFLGLEVTQRRGTVRYSPLSQEGEKKCKRDKKPQSSVLYPQQSETASTNVVLSQGRIHFQKVHKDLHLAVLCLYRDNQVKVRS